jgi:large subunit ribosomal protein L6
MSSRVARMPLVIPAGVDATIADGLLSVKGPLGSLSQAMSADVKVSRVEDRLEFEAVGESIQAKAMSGTLRALTANMVLGVSKGFERRLNLVGVGYRAQAQGDKLNLTLGFSHPVVHAMPKGVKVETPTQTEIVIKGIDKQQVGEVAAQVRAYRPPEPYKGKGVRYSNETIVLKETKKK